MIKSMVKSGMCFFPVGSKGFKLWPTHWTERCSASGQRPSNDENLGELWWTSVSIHVREQLSIRESKGSKHADKQILVVSLGVKTQEDYQLWQDRTVGGLKKEQYWIPWRLVWRPWQNLDHWKSFLMHCWGQEFMCHRWVWRHRWWGHDNVWIFVGSLCPWTFRWHHASF